MRGPSGHQFSFFAERLARLDVAVVRGVAATLAGVCACELPHALSRYCPRTKSYYASGPVDESYSSALL
jgi:hypothetical protein